MNSIRSAHSGTGPNERAGQVLPANNVRRAEHQVSERAGIEPDATGKCATGGNVRYGLPCARCRTYYRADLLTCPVCQSRQRISAGGSIRESELLGEEPPDEITLEQERERFLRDFELQLDSSRLQINAAATFRCTLEENHRGTEQPAEVCRGCYDHLQERVDLMEAALHIDLKEAAQIVYDAVWADPHSNKTYQNAAQALLTALRRRAGIAWEPFQQFLH
jgi:hypothetical protein